MYQYIEENTLNSIVEASVVQLFSCSSNYEVFEIDGVRETARRKSLCDAHLTGEIIEYSLKFSYSPVCVLCS